MTANEADITYTSIYFVHIPKTAGTSFSHALGPFCQTAPKTRLRSALRKLGLKQNPEKAHFRSHDSAWFVKRAFGESYQSFHVFSVVRNPFDHAVSHYTFLAESESKRTLIFAKQNSFSEYLDVRLGRKRRVDVPPFVTIGSQKSFVCDPSGHLIVDQIIKFESLAEEFPKLVDNLRLGDVELPVKRRTKSRTGNLVDYYDSETREKVLELYADDFEQFGYSRELSIVSN